jgi:hypothetical protein
MAQAVIRRLLTAKVRVRSRVNPCGICGGQSGTGTGFSPRVLRLSPVNFIPPVLHYLENKKKLIIILIIVITGVYNKPQGCGASVAPAAGPFTTKKNWRHALETSGWLKHIVLDCNWRRVQEKQQVKGEFCPQYTEVYLQTNKYHSQEICIIQCCASSVRLPLKRYQRSVESLANQNGRKISIKYIDAGSRNCETWHYTHGNTHHQHKMYQYIILKFNFYMAENTLHFHYKNNWLTLSREITVVYSKNLTKQINKMCAKTHNFYRYVGGIYS